MAGNGFTAFRQISYRAQSASTLLSETADVPASNRLMFGTMTLTPMQEFYAPEDEERNSIGSIHRATPVARHAEMRMEGSLQYERAPDFFAMALGSPNHAQAGIGSTTPGTPRSGTSGWHVWHYAPSMTTATTPVLYTFYYGDNSEVYAMRNSMCKSISLRYEMNNPVMISAEFFGGSVRDLDHTTVQATRATLDAIKQAQVNDAVSQLSDIYIIPNSDAGRSVFLGPDIEDPVTGGNWFTNTYAHGGLNYVHNLHGLKADGTPVAIPEGFSTDAVAKGVVEGYQKSGLISSMNITLPTGFEMTRYSSGSLDFTDYSQMKRSASIDLTLRHSDDGRTQFDKFLSSDTFNRSQLLRTVTKHADVNSGVRRFIVVDMAILYNDSPEFFTDVNGDNCFTMKASSYHDPSWGRDFEVWVHTDIDEELTAAHP